MTKNDHISRLEAVLAAATHLVDNRDYSLRDQLEIELQSAVDAARANHVIDAGQVWSNRDGMTVELFGMSDDGKRRQFILGNLPGMRELEDDQLADLLKAHSMVIKR